MAHHELLASSNEGFGVLWLWRKKEVNFRVASDRSEAAAVVVAPADAVRAAAARKRELLERHDHHPFGLAAAAADATLDAAAHESQVDHLEFWLRAVEKAAARERGRLAMLGIRRAVAVMDMRVVRLAEAAASAAVFDAVCVVVFDRVVVAYVEV